VVSILIVTVKVSELPLATLLAEGVVETLTACAGSGDRKTRRTRVMMIAAVRRILIVAR
jgi:hypothetical protein